MFRRIIADATQTIRELGPFPAQNVVMRVSGVEPNIRIIMDMSLRPNAVMAKLTGSQAWVWTVHFYEPGGDLHIVYTPRHTGAAPLIQEVNLDPKLEPEFSRIHPQAVNWLELRVGYAVRHISFY